MVYTMIGGMWSVTLTDSLQILIALVGLLVLAGAVFRQPELGDGSITAGVSLMVEKLNENHPGHLQFLPDVNAVLIMGWIGAWATGLFGCIPGQDLQQRVFASKDDFGKDRTMIVFLGPGAKVLASQKHPRTFKIYGEKKRFAKLRRFRAFFLLTVHRSKCCE